MGKINVLVRRVFVLLVLSVFAASNAGVLRAQNEEKPKLALKITAQKEVKTKKDGKSVTEYAAPDNTRKGDILLYTIEYKNDGKTEARDASIIDPVSSGTVYILESASGKNSVISYSVDSGNIFQKPPVKIEITKKDGTKELKPAPAERYTHIKWEFKKPIMSGQSGNVKFKAKVK